MAATRRTDDRIRDRDLFKVDVEALVNTVNCVGIMGRRLAVQLKRTALTTMNRSSESLLRW